MDSAASLMSEASTVDFMSGYVDPSETHLLALNSEDAFSAIVNLHPDSVRGRFFADVYASPSLREIKPIVSWALQLAASQHPDWQIWPGMNNKDYRLRQAWGSFGFSFLRQYFTMRMPIEGLMPLEPPVGVAIRQLAAHNDAELRVWHGLHQRAFSNHFGFAPRSFESWLALINGESSFDPNGVWLAELNGVPVGFCECSDEYAEDNRGFISSIGVVPEARGRGVGEALLRQGIAYCAKKGFSGVELNVDTGNESGALRLYEKVGFATESSWIQMSNEHWYRDIAAKSQGSQ